MYRSHTEPNSCEMLSTACLLCLFSSSFDASPSRRRHRQLSFSFFLSFILLVYAFEICGTYLLRIRILHKYPKKKQQIHTHMHAHIFRRAHTKLHIHTDRKRERLNIATWCNVHAYMMMMIKSSQQNAHTRRTRTDKLFIIHCNIGIRYLAVRFALEDQNGKMNDFMYTRIA